MSTYVSVRGWVECDDRQLALVRELVERAERGPRRYRGGWSFPAEQPMWGNAVFFAADLRAGEEEHLRELLCRIAALPPSAPMREEDDDERVHGLFLVSHEADGPSEWRLHGGGLHRAPLPAEHAYLV
ncbi:MULTISPECIES: hypothetical protein [Kitasatospora]|uniref:Uncharacterized protein n=1 Tax=Kitasatospora setae (strain ATCC 33774 / DSM 43861 / JCM 3304 / KCC A-0304 / NBRC 14216 / KM-6054) TaxID=452652 RepID=E4N1M8_KITSK|nr:MULTISPECIES: hypothetical protein [Kitasatospora]BAJ32062.1 hypothetical protein KSE_63040 [Kitasatospora setae KM-6054]